MADTYSCDAGGASAGAAGAVAFNSPHIIQYPKQYRPVDGKWAAISSIIGSLVGKWANADKLSEASDAEGKWKLINDDLYTKGKSEWERIAPERAKADAADDILDAKAKWECEVADAEKTNADKLLECADNSFEKLCQLMDCGYQPDYDGILARAKADAEREFVGKSEEMCRSLNRYNALGVACIEKELAMAKMSAVVGATTTARQQALETAWKMNSDLMFKVNSAVESGRLARQSTALSWANACTTIQTNRYNAHNQNGYESLRAGADLLASAGQNYAWLADSLRKSAELDAGNFGALAALVTALLPQFFQCELQEPEDCPPCSGKTCEEGQVLDENCNCVAKPATP